MATTQHHSEGVSLSAGDRARLGRWAQLLAGASVTYNVLEAVVAITAGVVAGSVALVGFGLDSVVEVSSGLIILWQFRHTMPETREKRALRLMAFSFFALAAYVSIESVRALLGQSEPEPSLVGIGLAAASLVIMPLLSWAQRRTGRAVGSNAVVADSTQTLLCTYLSAVLLVGLVLNATLGWSWAGPDRWSGDRCRCGPGGPRGVARRRGAAAPLANTAAEADGCKCSDGSCGAECCTRADSVADAGGPMMQIQRFDVRER